VIKSEGIFDSFVKRLTTLHGGTNLESQEYMHTIMPYNITLHVN